MNKEIQMKQHILNMLKEIMLGESGKKLRPAAVSVEMVGKPKVVEGKEGLEDVLKEASEEKEDESLAEEAAEEAMEDDYADEYADKHNAGDAAISEKDWEDSDEDEEADKKMGKMSLQEFLASRSR